MKLKEGFVLREVAGDIVVIPSGDTLDLNMMITLNETGRFLWAKLEAGAEMPELVQALTQEYEVSAQDAERHIEKFVAKLNENGLLA